MRTLGEVLADEHRRLQVTLAAIDRTASDRRYGFAARLCRRFLAALRDHHRHEEDELLPQLTGERFARLGAVIRHEHGAIEVSVEEMAEALERRSVVAFGGARKRLAFVLSEHQMKEELLMVPLVERKAWELR